MDSTTISPVSKAAPYVYEPLNHSSSQIRIFTLLPSAEKASQLRGILRIASLTPTPPQYEALSYVWGDQTNQSSVWIGDEELEISENLSKALHRLRHSSQPRDLWVDAICISQGSSDEKNHQVRQMYIIYSQSSRVLIWLGEADDDSDYSMDHLEHIRAGSVRALDWARAGNIFHRTWWRRVWTLQEAFAANESSLVLCGEKEVLWSLVMSVIDSITGPPDFYQYAAVVSPELGNFGEVRKFRLERKKSTFTELICASVSRAAKDPRDRIFALLGLLEIDDTDYFEPDYSKTVSWTYQKATIKILESRQNLHILIFKAKDCDMENCQVDQIPSWCIKFSRSFSLTLLTSLGIFFAMLGNVVGAYYRRENASIAHDFEHGTLTVRGTVVGRMTQTQSVCADVLAGYDLMESISDTLQTLSGNNKTKQKEVYKVLFYAMVLKTFTRLKIDTMNHQKSQDFAIHCEDPIFQDPTTELFQHWQKEWGTLQTPEPPDGKDLTLFAADTGYMGACGECSIPRDAILCIISGCKLPLVLTQNEDRTYRIVDAAYVHGIMNGEFLSDEAAHEEVEFVIG